MLPSTNSTTPSVLSEVALEILHHGKPKVSSVSHMWPGFVSTPAIFELPEFLYSVEALEFCDFTRATVRRILVESSAIDAREPTFVNLHMCVIECIKCCVRYVAVGEQGDWGEQGRQG